MENLFRDNPIEYAFNLIDENRTNHIELLTACLKWMSHDQIRDMLTENELDPDSCAAFDEGYYSEEISNEEKYACEMYNERYVFCD